MIYQIAYYQIVGFPLIKILGLITLLFLIATVTIVILNKKGFHIIPMKWHFRCGKVTLVFGLIHGILGISIGLF